MSPNDAARLVDMLIDAYRIAGHIDEEKNPRLFSDIDLLCSDLRSFVIGQLTVTNYQLVTSSGGGNIKPLWTPTCKDSDNGGVS